MKTKMILEESNKYSGNETNGFKKSMIYFATAVICGMTLFMEGCLFPSHTEALAPDYTPVSTITSSPIKTTPIVINTPTSTPTATIETTPSPTPYVEYTKDEKIDMLCIADKEGEYTIGITTVIKYTVDGQLFFAITFNKGSETTTDLYIVDYFSGEEMFKTDYDNFVGVPYIRINLSEIDVVANGYLEKDVKILKVFPIDSLEDELVDSGITPVESKYRSAILDGYTNMKATEVADYFVTVVPQENIPFPYLFMGEEIEDVKSPTK